jgi:cardiolipin synthase
MDVRGLIARYLEILRPSPGRLVGMDVAHVIWSIVAAAVIVAGYFWKRSARLLKQPIRLDYGPADPAFAVALGPVVGAEFVGGNTVETLVNGDQFFPAMLRAIRGAQRTITLESYIWSSGEISDQFIAALSERARAGIKIHIMVDGWGTLKFRRRDRQRLRQAGVELYVYGRRHWFEIKPDINHHTHRKLLIIDGRIGFTGGMCIDDCWQGNADTAKVWRETQVQVTGPVVRQMQATFATNWLQTTTTLLLGDEYFPTVPGSGDSRAHCYKSGPGEAAQVARLGYLFAVASARRTIDIAHAYFVPDDLAVAMLLEARERGVRVRVIVPAINDSRFGRAASRSRWGRLLAAGVEFYRYTAAMYHPKTMVIDETLLTIGSANFDNRSFSLNDEVVLDVLDAKVAARFTDIFADDLKRSERITLEAFRSRPLYIKVLDHFCGLFRSML